MQISWRDQILSEFTPKVNRLTLVADPDGLLLEEGAIEGIRNRGFELIPFEDPITFRYAYESKFRSRWDRGEKTDLVVMLRSPSSDLDTLPYDLLQAGRKLSFSLSNLFPNLSYPVVAALDRADLGALYEAQLRYALEQLGDNATKDFVLRHVFGIVPELIRESKDLLRVLLRRHFRGMRIPAILNESALSRCFAKATFSKIGLWKPLSRTRKHSLRSCRSAGPCSWICSQRRRTMLSTRTQQRWKTHKAASENTSIITKNLIKRA